MAKARRPDLSGGHSRLCDSGEAMGGGGGGGSGCVKAGGGRGEAEGARQCSGQAYVGADDADMAASIAVFFTPCDLCPPTTHRQT